MKLVSIITINFNGLNDTCALIETIPFHDNLEVIVVDNASNNQKAETDTISQKYPHVTVIKSEQNLGFAGGNNLGIKVAQGKYLFFINNDTIFKEFNVQPLIDRLESSPEIAIVCPKIRFAWGTHPIQFTGYTPLSKITVRNQAIGFGEEDNGQYDTAHPTPYAHGAAMLIKREAIDKVGLMPDCFFLYYEELDWSMMFTRAGFEIWYDPTCTVYHKESQATGQKSPLRTYYIVSPLRTYYIVRNRLLLVKRNWCGITKYLSYAYLLGVVGVRDILKYALSGKWELLKATTNGLRDFYNNQFSARLCRLYER